jgi:hypothetical protein
MYRQIGTKERLFWSYPQLRPVHFILTANIVGFLHPKGLRQAGAKVLHRHPLLDLKIAPGSDFSSAQIDLLQQTAMQFLN